MEKESYSIDDILSDIKRHKEMENRKPDDNEEKKPVENEDFDNNEELTLKEENEETADVVSHESEGESADEEKNSDTAEKQAEPESVEEEEFVLETVDENGVVEPEEKKEDAPLTASEDMTESDSDDYVDLMAMSIVEEEANGVSADTEEGNENEANEKSSKKPSKRKKALKLLRFAIILLLIIAIGVGIYAYIEVKSWADLIANNEGQQSEYINTEWESMDNLAENFPEIYETEASQLSSLQDMIKTWYYNGAPCSSSHVLNILLIGEDTRGDEILEDETRADAAIIASVNVDTKTITLTSVLRDAYAYWENVPGDASTGQFGKINGAMATAGIDGYINCVEKLYKIDIDNYAIVNFDSFESIIDELGGVELEITASEIREINNNPDTYGYVTIDQTFDGSSGYMTLTGEQALAYCRIRHLDSDNKRADRQKYCLSQIFEQASGASTTTQLKVIKSLIPYLHTGFKSDQILSMANYAISHNWLGYSIQSITVPNSRIGESGSGGIYYGAWCWKADFPQDANFLQTILYGKSSITLASSRVDVLNCNLYGFYEDSYIPCYATITNYNYGEATTYELTTQEEDEEY